MNVGAFNLIKGGGGGITFSKARDWGAGGVHLIRKHIFHFIHGKASVCCFSQLGIWTEMDRGLD